MNRNEFFQALTVTKLTLRLTGATLEVCTDDIEDIHVMASGAKVDVDALRIAASAEGLTVEQPVSALAKSAAAADRWLQIAIRLPRSWKGAIDARSVTGWMNIRAVNGTDLALDSVSGMLMLSDLNFLTLSARTVTGDVKLNQVECGKCSLLTTSGEIRAMRTALAIGSASTVTGDAAFELLAPFEELTLSSVTGDLCVDAPVTHCDAVLRSVSGRIRTSGVSIGEGGAKLRATTVSSDLDIACNIE